MALSTVRDLFIHELSHAISAEQQMLQLLPEWQAEALNHEVKEALSYARAGNAAAGDESAGGL